ncbi:hypothetical protein JCM9957A_23810 [Kineosporia succinea]
MRATAWILIGAGGLVAAIASLTMALASSQANGQWQDSVRAQVRYSASTVENIRAVYLDEAPLAFQLRSLTIQAEELERRVTGEPGVPGARAAAHRATVQTYLRAYEDAGLEVNPAATAALDPRRRLAQAQKTVTLDETNRLEDAGEQQARRGTRAGWTVVGAALAVVGGFALLARTRRAPGGVPVPGPPPRPTYAQRGPLVGPALVLTLVLLLRRSPSRAGVVAVPALWVGFALGARRRAAPVEPVPDEVVPDEVTPDIPLGPPEIPAAGISGNRMPWVSLAVGVTAAVLTVLQLQAATDEARWQAEAARGASMTAAAADGGVIVDAFETNAQQTAVLLAQGADDLDRAGARGEPGAATSVLAAADRAAAERMTDLADRMGRTPDVGDGIDASTRIIVSGSPIEQQDLLQRQHTAVDRAESSGSRANLLVYALLIITFLNIAHQNRPHVLRWARERARRARA